jgi:anaerobic selenocysteine-containing dehydrogenase
MDVVRTVCAHDCPDMCSLLVSVEAGRITRIQGDPDHPVTAGFACAKVSRDMELVHSPERLRTPLRRVGPKGSGRFEPTTWDSALDEVVSRWQAIIRDDGPEAILGYAYSSHQGQINRGLLLGLFHALGATRLTAGTVCDTCAEAGWDAALGAVGGADPEQVVESDLVVVWGADLVTTNVHMWPLVGEARRRGAMLVVVDPRRSRTAEQADWHVRVAVGSDAALALGVMHVLARDGLADRAYLARETVGFDRLEREVLPRFDPARTAALTGVPADEIVRFAHAYGRARAPFIRLGEGMSRCVQGGQATRAVALLPGVVGAYAKRGGGALLMTAAGFGLRADPLRKPGGARTARSVNHSRLGEALLTFDRPRLRALFVAANNPAVTCPDAGAVRRGLARDDLFTVVHDPFLSDTARYADIVLPAATYLESDDLYRAYGTYYAQRGRAAVPPQGEAWPNRRLAQALAVRLGLTDPIWTMDTEGLAGALLGASPSLAGRVSLADWLSGRPLKVAPHGPQQFATPSGKLEFYSETLAARGQPALPDFEADAEANGRSGPYPLRLLTAPGYFQPHTAFSGVASLRGREGAPAVTLHPEDAARRGLTEGAPVRLHNDRGEISLALRVSDAAPRGVALVVGQRPAGEAHAGTVNMLVGPRYSDLGEGATYQSTWLEVSAAEPCPPMPLGTRR